MNNKKPLPPINEIKKLFAMNGGDLIWLPRPEMNRFDKTWNKKNAMRPAGTIRKNGYRKVNLNGEHYYAHRIAFLLQNGFDPAEKEIDHPNGNKLDNSNLRLADHSQNNINKRLLPTNKSGVKGVYFDASTQSWKGCVTHRNKRYYVKRNTDKSLVEAEVLRLQLMLHGDFRRD